MTCLRYDELFYKDAQPTVVLRLGSLDPSDPRRTIDDQEEGEEHDREDIAQYYEESDTGNAIYKPIDPRIRLAVNEPVVSQEGRRDEESVEE